MKEKESMSSILGVETGTKLSDWSDDQVQQMMFQVTRNVSRRSELSEEKRVRLEELEEEWKKRKNISTFKYIL